MTTPAAAPAAVEPHSAPGGAVYETGLRPKFGKVHTLRCGCRSDDTRHLAFCEAQHALVLAHKARVAADRRAAASRETTPGQEDPFALLDHTATLFPTPQQE